MPKKNILIIGYGSIGKQYYFLLNKNYENYNIIIVSRHKNNNKNIVFEKSINYVLKKYSIYAAIVCSPASKHLSNLTTLLLNKVHVLVEKPLFDKPIKKKKINYLLNLINKNRLFVLTGYLLRYHPLLAKLKKEIEKHKVKNIINIEMKTSSYLPRWRSTPYQVSVSAKKKLGGGVLNELSHEIDIINYLFGITKSLFSRVMNTKKLKINVEDVAEAVISFKSKFKIFLHLNFSSYLETRYIKVNLKKYTLFFDFLKGTFIKKEKEKNKISKSVFKISKSSLLQKQFNFFIKSISKKKFNNKNFISSVCVLNLIDKLKQSSLSNSEIKIS